MVSICVENFEWVKKNYTVNDDSLIFCAKTYGGKGDGWMDGGKGLLTAIKKASSFWVKFWLGPSLGRFHKD